MPLESLQIENFQTHSKERFDLSRRLTTIIGPSDAGKSAVIRALGWIAMNRPRGESFVKHGSGEARALLTLDGGRKIGRRRGKAVNEYRIDSESIKAFGSDVPEQVADLLGVDPELNFQQQHDAPFWVGLSAPELARQLNRVVDLEVIDKVAQRLAQKGRKAKDQCQLLEEELEGLSGKLEALSEAPVLEALLEDATKAQEHASLLRENAELLAGLLARLREARQRARPAQQVAQVGREAQQVLKAYLEQVCKISALQASVDGLSRTSPKPPGGWDAVQMARRTALEARAVVDKLLAAVESVESAEAFHKKRKAELKAAKQELHDSTGGRCPVCKQPMEVS